MREIIKEYELNPDVSIDKIIDSKFIYKDSCYIYKKELMYDIYLIIKIKQDQDCLIFNDKENTKIVIGEYNVIYEPFYDENSDFEVLNGIIIMYNNVMDGFVRKGILIEKELKNNKKLIKEV